MSELYFVASGPLHWQKEFEDHLKAAPFVIEGIAPNGQRFAQGMSGLLEPIQLYRFIVPEAAIPYAVRTLTRNKKNPDGLALPIWGMKKALGLQDVPTENEPAGPVMNVPTDHMQIIMIGYKPEPPIIVPSTGVKQEPV